jgi:hypothetical protein
MLDWVAEWLFNDGTGSSDREKAVSLGIIAAIILFVAPLFACPCGGRPDFRITGTPTPDRAEFQMTICKACQGSGRRSIWDRWFGEAPQGKPGSTGTP